RPALSQRYVAPRTPTEQALAQVWQEVLNLDRVGVNDNFYELGGDSILGIQIAARAARHGIKFGSALLFRKPTISEIAHALVSAEPPAGEHPGRSLAENRVWPLTSMQAGMLFHSLLEEDRGAYVQQMVWRLPAHTDRDRLTAAWHTVVNAHDALRVCFRWADRTVPAQVIAPAVNVDCATLDWSTAGREEVERNLSSFLAVDRARSFPLDRAPLMRLTWIETRDHDMLVWTHHHAILDGWSVPIVLSEVASTYEARSGPGLLEPAGRPGVPEFSAYLDWLASRDTKAAHEFWATHLDGFDGARSFGALTLRPQAEPVGTRHAVTRVAPALDAALRALASRCQVTLNTVIQGAWALMLARWAASTETLFGIVVSGRQDSVPGAEGIVGMCMNTVPIRVPVPIQGSVSGWLRRVQDLRLAVQEHEWVPLVDVQRIAGANREQPLFSTLVVYENFPQSYPASGPGLFGDLDQVEQHTADEIMLVVAPDPVLRLRLSAAGTKLASSDLEDVLAQFTFVLTQLADGAAEDDLGEVSVLSQPEVAQVVARSTGLARQQARPAVHAWFSDQARRTPDAVALIDGTGRMTFRDLDNSANRLANYLAGQGVSPRTRVGICIERGVGLVVALLATLKAGACYVPLEPGDPDERRAYMLRDAGARFLLTQRGLADGDLEFAGQVVFTDHIADELEQVSAAEPGVEVEGNDLAYIIYTSGSTGRPKGVMIEHHALTNFVAWCVAAYTSPQPGGTAVFSSIAFDAVVPNLYPPLVSGRSVHLLPESFPAERLGDLLLPEAPYCFLKVTPSHLRILAHQLSPEQAGRLAGHLIVGAEAFPAAVLRDWRSVDPRTPVFNEYGPTEATVANSLYLTGNDDVGELLPIGAPIANTTMYVLDADMRPIPPGVIGELYLGGACVARGYAGKPSLTAERFVPDPFVSAPGARLYRTGDLGRMRPDGDFEFCGRVDDQIKIRGYRIEPAEIEAALLRHESVSAAYVRAWPFPSGQRLVAYVAGAGPDQPSATELREHIGRILPQHLHPSHYVAVDAIPLTPHGKIDRRALPDPAATGRGAAEAARPTSDIEQAVAEVWATVLGLDEVGIDDNFYELGGDSILSIAVISQLASRGIKAELRELFAGPTVRQLSQQARRLDSGTGRLGLAAVPEAAGTVPLTPVQRWFFDLDMVNPHHYNQWLAFRIRREHRDMIADALRAVVAGHDAFRLRFRADASGRPIQCYTDGDDTQDWLLTADVSKRLTGTPELAAAELTAIADKLQRGLDIHSGPLFRAVIVDVGEADAVRIILVAHHLVIDTVSWRILAADLENAADAIAQGRPVAPVAGTTSFGSWAAGLAGHASAGTFDGQLGYWREQLAGAVPLFRAGRPAGNVSGAARFLTSTLSADVTGELIRGLPRRRGVRINGVLLAGLSLAARHVLDRDEFAINVEGHGREPLSGDTDLTRTVGWFTSIFPVRLSCQGTVSEVLGATAEHLAAIPDNGLGYGVLRHLAERDCGDDGRVDGCFNYLGQLGKLGRDAAPGGLLTAAQDFRSSSVDPGNKRGHLLDITSWVSGGELTTRWTYVPSEVPEDTVAALSDAYLGALRKLAEEC
ncbi:MAG TPA: amino acid adenylation domain-containing protein, partial [Streptosporangiaceae bacterium]|nr:amino acid adenylation domain-containing protein [Streptosporangiaceae bacterium]